MSDTSTRTEAILNKLRQRTALSQGELLDLQTALEQYERALAGSHHFAISHHTKATQELSGVLDRK